MVPRRENFALHAIHNLEFEMKNEFSESEKCYLAGGWSRYSSYLLAVGFVRPENKLAVHILNMY